MIHTLKQKRLEQAILSKDNIGKPLSEVAKGIYADGSKQIYRNSTKQHLFKALNDKGIDKHSITEVLSTLGNLARNKGDITNSLRAVEDIAKIHALYADANANITINQANVLDSIRASDRAEAIEVDKDNVPRV